MGCSVPEPDLILSSNEDPVVKVRESSGGITDGWDDTESGKRIEGASTIKADIYSAGTGSVEEMPKRDNLFIRFFSFIKGWIKGWFEWVFITPPGLRFWINML